MGESFSVEFEVAVNHIVALSGGKDSTALALALREIEPESEYTYICTPTKNELPEMSEHWAKLERLLDAKLVRPKTESLASLVYRQKAVPNFRMRWCTRLIKILPFETYILEHLPCTVYVGLRADEGREGVEYSDLASLFVKKRFPLVEWGWGRSDVVRFLDSRGVTVPERTDCALCFFQTLWEWYQLWLNHPRLYQQGVAWEKFTGHTLRSDQRDTWPAALEDLAKEFARGRIPVKRTMKDRPAMCSVCAR